MSNLKQALKGFVVGDTVRIRSVCRGFANVFTRLFGLFIIIPALRWLNYLKLNSVVCRCVLTKWKQVNRPQWVIKDIFESFASNTTGSLIGYFGADPFLEGEMFVGS